MHTSNRTVIHIKNKRYVFKAHTILVSQKNYTAVLTVQPHHKSCNIFAILISYDFIKYIIISGSYVFNNVCSVFTITFVNKHFVPCTLSVIQSFGYGGQPRQKFLRLTQAVQLFIRIEYSLMCDFFLFIRTCAYDCQYSL